MRKITILILSGLLVALSNSSVFATERGVGKIDICHFDKEYGVFELISVGAPSMGKHMTNHGDKLYGTFVTANDDPIYSNAEAQGGECASRCSAEGGIFTGQWWTTVFGVSSVCQCTTC